MERPQPQFKTLELFLPTEEQKGIKADMDRLFNLSGPLQFTLKKGADRATRTQSKINELRGYEKSVLARGVRSKDDQSNSEYIGSLIGSLNLMYELEDLVLRNGVDTNGFAEQIEADLIKYVGTLTARIHGVAVEDFSKGQTVAPFRALPYFVECLRLNSHSLSEKVSSDVLDGLVAENMVGIRAGYPNKTKLDIASAVVTMAGILETEDAMLTGKPKRDFPEGFAMKSFNSLSKSINSSRREIFKTLLNPDSTEETKRLISSMSEYMSEDAFVVVSFLAAGIFTNQENARTMYRKAKENSETGVYPEFYKKIIEVIEDAAKAEDPRDIVFVKDVDLIEGIDISPPSERFFDESKELVKEIFQLSSEGVYNISDPDGVFHNYITVFDQQNPMRLNLTLQWLDRGEQEKQTTIALDLKKKDFEWSFFDSPTAETSKELRLLIERSSIWTLQQIKVRAEEIHAARFEAKKGAEVPQAHTNGGKKVKEHFRDPIYDLRKETVQSVRSEQRRNQRAEDRRKRGLA